MSRDVRRPDQLSGGISWLPAAAVASLLAVLGLAVAWRHQPPPVVPISAPPALFSAERALLRLEQILGNEGPHPLGSPANDAIRGRIIKQLEELGLDPEENEHWVSGSNKSTTSLVRARNIMAELPSSNPDLPAIMLACHYDSVPAGPGVADDGAAAAAMLEVASILARQTPLARPVMLLFTDGEELSLYGARGFCTFNENADRVGMIINFEARGSGGGSLMFETSPNNRWIIGQLARGLARPMSSSAYVSVYRMMPNSSDLTAFMRRDLAGINFAFIGNPKHYHTSLDNLENLDLRSLQHHGDNALGMVRQLLSSDWSEAEAEDDAVYTDLAATVIVAWPRRWGPWMAGIILLALYLPFRRLQQSRRWDSVQVTRAISCWLLCILIGITTGWLAAWVLQTVDHTSTPWPDSMPVHTLAPCLCAAIGVLLTLLFFRPRPALIFCIHGLGLAVSGLLLALFAPGFSYLFILPAFIAALASPFLLSGERQRPFPLALASLLAASSTIILMVPLLLRLPESLGIGASAPVVSAVVSLLLLPVVPLLCLLSTVSLSRVCLALLLGAVGSVWFAVINPSFTPDSPQQINLTFLQEEGEDTGQLSLFTWEGSLPDTLTDGLSPVDAPNPLYRVRGSSFETSKADVPLPQMELLQWNFEDNLHTAKLRFTPTAPTQQIVAGISETQGLHRISALGNTLPLPEESHDGHKWLRLRGIPEDGIEIELSWEGPPKLPLLLAGVTPGLPDHLQELADRRDLVPACRAHHGDQSISLKSLLLESPVF